MNPRTLRLAGALLVILGRLLYVLHVGHAFEDAFINFRCANHWLAFGRPDYNPGVPLMSVTSAIWLCITTACTAIVGDRDPSLLVQCVNIALDVATYALVARRLERGALIAWILAFATLPSLVVGPAFGLEVNLLVFAGVAAAMTNGRARLLALALCGVVRPESMVYAAVLALALEGPRRTQFAAAAAGVALQFGFNRLMWGAPMPQTVVAKSTVYGINWFHGTPYVDWLLPLGSTYFADATPFLLTAALWLPTLPCIDRRFLALAGAALAVVAVYFVTGPFAFQWYLVPPLAFLAAAAAAGVGPALYHGSPASRAIFAVFVAFAVLFAWLRFLPYDTRRLAIEDTYAQIGQLISERTPPDATVVLEPAGIAPWHFRNPVIDEVGLVDRDVPDERARGDGWLYRISVKRKPAVFVSRLALILQNNQLGGISRPFKDDAEREEFARHYQVVAAGAAEIAANPYHATLAVLVRLDPPRANGSLEADLRELAAGR